MATKQFYATGAFKYGTRMMQAGDPVTMDAPTARLFTALGKISATKPKGAPQIDETSRSEVETVPARAPKPARKRTTRRKK